MLKVSLNKSTNRLVLTTDEPGLHYFLETKQKDWQYLPWKKEWGYAEKTVKIYDPGKHSLGNGMYTYSLGLGWAAYLLGVFKDRLSKDDYNGIVNEVIFADTYRDVPFPELRDYQNSDVLFMLKYRTGLFQCNTAYG